MLIELLNLIRKEIYLSSKQIAKFLNIDEYALQPLLDLLIKKNMICLVKSEQNCNSKCVSCSKDLIYMLVS